MTICSTHNIEAPGKMLEIKTLYAGILNRSFGFVLQGFMQIPVEQEKKQIFILI